jgi:hypothetical protein
MSVFFVSRIIIRGSSDCVHHVELYIQIPPQSSHRHSGNFSNANAQYYRAQASARVRQPCAQEGNPRDHAQYDDPVSKPLSAASWSSLNRFASSCHVSWCVFLKLAAHLRTALEIGIWRARTRQRTARAGRPGATHRVVRVLGEHAREKLGHPALDRVRVCVDERAHAEDRRVPLADRARVRGRAARRERLAREQAREAFLEREHAPARGHAQDARQRARGHLPHVLILVVEAAADGLEERDALDVPDVRHLPEVEHCWSRSAPVRGRARAHVPCSSGRTFRRTRQDVDVWIAANMPSSSGPTMSVGGMTPHMRTSRSSARMERSSLSLTRATRQRPGSSSASLRGRHARSAKRKNSGISGRMYWNTDTAFASWMTW